MTIGYDDDQDYNKDIGWVLELQPAYDDDDYVEDDEDYVSDDDDDVNYRDDEEDDDADDDISLSIGQLDELDSSWKCKC